MGFIQNKEREMYQKLYDYKEKIKESLASIKVSSLTENSIASKGYDQKEKTPSQSLPPNQ